jgi:aminopeptidase N
MNRVALIAPVVALFLLACVPIVVAQEASPVMEYRLSLRFDPETHLIAGRARITAPSDSCFYLASALHVERVAANGKAVEVLSAKSISVPGSKEICVQSVKPKLLEVEYSGRLTAEAIRNSTTQTNMVEPKLVELSNFLDWYPRMKQGSGFRYKLETDLPAGFTSVTNGRLVKEHDGKERVTSEWESSGTSYGITLVAAPHMKKAEIAGRGARIEIYYDKLPQTYVDSMRRDLITAMQSLQNMFGAPGNNNLVRVVYSPRGAGGYARAPLFVVSESFALEQMPHRFGAARDLRLNVHEMAHYWSRADTRTADDWLNEGLADFSALLVSEQIAGKEFADLLLKEYEDVVYGTPTTHSVLETESGSWEANVNRYYKPTLLLNDLRRQYGDPKVREFLRALYARLAQDQATTAVFLDQLEKSLGKAAREQFADGLARKTWAKAGSAATASASDPDLIGTWTGMLTQSGTPYKFVLHLKDKEGMLVATLDSPDQNVNDIPVSEVNFVGDMLKLKVAGAASATYHCKIERAKHKLEGEWVQMGVTYPLNLTRSGE